MSKDKLVPEIRFPEFKEGEEWVVKKLGLLTNTTIGEFVIKTKQDPKSPYPVYNGGKSYTGFYDEYNNEANKIVISARGANAGFVNLVKQKYWAGNSCYSVEVLEQDKINLELLFYYLKHNQRRFTDNQQAANIPSVSKGDVEKFKICYPEDILEQQKIASCLSSLDEVIAAHSQKLELLKEHKKGLMQNLFPQEGEKVPNVRFKEFEKDGEWVEKSIQSLIDNKIIISHLDGNHGALYPKAEEFSEDGIPYITANDFISGFVDFSKCKHLPLHRAKKFKKGVAKDGDILFAHNATVGPVAKLITDLPFVILSTTATYFRCDNKLLINDFLKFVLSSPFFVNQYTRVMSQSTRNQVPITTQRQFYILVPKPSEQQKVASCLSSLDALISAQTEKIDQLQQHKKGLMQGLFPKIEN